MRPRINSADQRGSLDRIGSLTMHVPVMLGEVMGQLALAAGDDAVDCTFGGGGYTRAMLAASAPDGRVLAIDRDPEAIARGERMPWTAAERDRFTLVHGSFEHVAALAEQAGLKRIRGIVADLGCSSDQLTVSDRGFSFGHDGPLDMRFDPTSGASAASLIADASIEGLEEIIRSYGEDSHARRIARAIIAARDEQLIATTGQLAAIIAGAIGRRSRIHPATRTFQALRIAVNDELGTLRRGIAGMLDCVAPGGRVVIVSFHSLEDRIVKRAFRAAATQGRGAVLTKRPLRPSREEIMRNPRSRSARQRTFEQKKHG